MKKEIQIVVPQNWSGVTLKKYLALQRDLKVYGEEESGFVACLLHHICGVDSTIIHQLPSDILTNIKMDLRGFMGQTDIPLQRIITIDGKKFGFEPNLSKMSYGAYLDATKWDSINIDEHWAKIMSVLYRPIKSQTLTQYEVEDYDGTDRSKLFEEVGMDVHFGTLFFFLRLLTDLPNAILNSLEKEELPPNIKQTLVENGNLIKQLYNYPTTISPSSVMFSKEDWKSVYSF